MLPAKLAAEAAGAADPARVAWQAGLVACLGSGLIELVGAARRRARPPGDAARGAALDAGRHRAQLHLARLPLPDLRPPDRRARRRSASSCSPTSAACASGRPARAGWSRSRSAPALAWATGIAPAAADAAPGRRFYLPVPVLGDLLAGLAAGHLLAYLSVILPMGLFNVLGSLQNIESAEAAGDRYPTAPSLAVNGIGTLAAARSARASRPRSTSAIPGWKALGARAGYSVLNGVFVTVVCLTGTLACIAWAVPIDAGMAIVLWIGIVITAQAFQATPREHAPAVVVGLLPGVARLGRADGEERAARRRRRRARRPAVLAGADPAFHASDTWIDGAFALEQGFIFTAMILSAATVGVIERRFRAAAAWCVLGAVPLGARADALLPLDARRHGHRARRPRGRGRAATRSWRRCSPPPRESPPRRAKEASPSSSDSLRPRDIARDERAKPRMPSPRYNRSFSGVDASPRGFDLRSESVRSLSPARLLNAPGRWVVDGIDERAACGPLPVPVPSIRKFAGLYDTGRSRPDLRGLADRFDFIQSRTGDGLRYTTEEYVIRGKETLDRFIDRVPEREMDFVPCPKPSTPWCSARVPKRSSRAAISLGARGSECNPSPSRTF